MSIATHNIFIYCMVKASPENSYTSAKRFYQFFHCSKECLETVSDSKLRFLQRCAFTSDLCMPFFVLLYWSLHSFVLAFWFPLPCKPKHNRFSPRSKLPCVSITDSSWTAMSFAIYIWKWGKITLRLHGMTTTTTHKQYHFQMLSYPFLFTERNSCFHEGAKK